MKLTTYKRVDIHVNASGSDSAGRFYTEEDFDEPFNGLKDSTLEGLQGQIDKLGKVKVVMRDGIRLDRYTSAPRIEKVKVGTLTRQYNSNYVWITGSDKDRSKVKANTVFPSTAANLDVAAQWLELQKKANELQEQAEGLVKRMESFDPESVSEEE